MKIKTVISTEIKFSIRAYIATEGGMDTESYGPECNELHEAVVLYRQAMVARPDIDWIIEGRVNDIIEQLKPAGA